MTKKKKKKQIALQKPMKPDEYIGVKEALGWSHDKLGHTIGVTERTPYRYASGDVDIPEPVARLMRTLVFCRYTLSARKFDELIRELTG